MMSDTGLYLNWIPNTLIADEDEEFEPTSEDNTLVVGFVNGNMVALPNIHQQLPSSSSVFSVNFARS